MGIKNLKKFLRERDLISKIHLIHFSFKIIAIDISSYIYKYKIIFSDNWISSFIKMFTVLRKNNVHAVFIFDGKSPIEKEKEKEKRKKIRDHLDENVFNIQLEVEKRSRDENYSSELLIHVMKKIIA